MRLQDAGFARAMQFANQGIPARAAGLISNEFEALLARIAALENRIAELEKKGTYPAHMKGVERR